MQGIQGSTGVQGATGVQGSTGVQGITGPTGPKIAQDWTTAHTYVSGDYVVALYESEYRLFRAIADFLSAGTPFPGSQTIATVTNSYVGEWQ